MNFKFLDWSRHERSSFEFRSKLAPDSENCQPVCCQDLATPILGFFPTSALHAHGEQRPS